MKRRHIPLILIATLTLLGSCSNPGKGLTFPTSQEQGLSIRFEKESLTLYVEDTYQLNVIHISFGVILFFVIAWHEWTRRNYNASLVHMDE